MMPDFPKIPVPSPADKRSVKMQSRAINWREKSGAMILDMAAAAELLPDRSRLATNSHVDYSKNPTSWYPWGSNNLLPYDMISDIKKTGILTSITEGKARFATCEGPVPVITELDRKTGRRIIKEYLDDEEINRWMMDNDMYFFCFSLIQDYIKFHRMVVRIMLNEKRDYISRIRREDVSQHRLGKADGKGVIKKIYFSKEWCKVTGDSHPSVFNKPLLRMDAPLSDLVNQAKYNDKQFEYALVRTHPGNDEEWYPVPNWMANILWIRIVQAIPTMKEALYKNAIRAKFKITIYESFWENNFGDRWMNAANEQERDAMVDEAYDEIDEFLAGAENAGKAIFVHGFRGHDGKMYSDVDIESIPDDTKQGEYLPDSAAGNSEIAFSLLWNNAITGGNQKNGLYSENQGGSNVREAGMMQTIIHEPERQQIGYILNLVSEFNGWNKKHKGLRWIIPATVLTTLDTGSSSKTVITGDAKTADA